MNIGNREGNKVCLLIGKYLEFHCSSLKEKQPIKKQHESKRFRKVKRFRLYYLLWLKASWNGNTVSMKSENIK